MTQILVIDDDPTVLESMKAALDTLGYEAAFESDPETAIDLYDKTLPDAVITDMKMPKLSGMEVIERIKSRHPEAAIIVVTGHGDIANAVEAVKKGAFDYITKPFDIDRVDMTIQKAVAQKKLQNKNRALQR